MEVTAEQLCPGLGSESPAGPWRVGSPRIMGSEGLCHAELGTGASPWEGTP